MTDASSVWVHVINNVIQKSKVRDGVPPSHLAQSGSALLTCILLNGWQADLLSEGFEVTVLEQLKQARIFLHNIYFLEFYLHRFAKEK